MQHKEFDFVEFWANKCKQNMAACQKEVAKLTNSQITNANSFYKRLALTKNGKQTIRQLKKI